MKNQIRKTVSILLVLIMILNLSEGVFAVDVEPTTPTNTQSVTTTTGMDSGNDFIIRALQSTIVGDYNEAYIDISISSNTTMDTENLVAYAKINNPFTVHIANDGVFRLGNNGGQFRVPLYTLDSNEDKTIPIEITLKYDISTEKTSETKVTTTPIVNGEEDEKNQNVNSTTVTNIGTESKEMTTTIYVVHRARKVPKNSMIEVEKFEILPNGYVVPGSEFELVFSIKNPGDAPASNVKLSLDGLDAKGINMAKGLSTVDTTTLNPGDARLIRYYLKIPASAKGGQYPLTLKYTFNGKNEKGEDTTSPVEGSYTFSVDVKQADMAPSSIIFERIDFPTGRLGKNQPVKVSFSLKNIGTKNAQNIKISAISKDVEGLLPVSGSNAIVASLKPGQVANYSFDFKTANAVSTKTYPVEITVEYIDDAIGEEPHKIVQVVGVNGVDWYAEQQKYKDLPKSTPILIIEKYDFNPEVIFAGTQFTMKLDIRNTSSSKSIKNIKISLTSDVAQSADQGAPAQTASVFTPVQSSNTFFIDHIPAGEKIEKAITMTTSHDTAAKTYTLTANLEYEDGQANPYKSSEIIGITVVQDSKLSIGEVNIDPEYFVGTPGSLNVEFYNTGKVTLSNFMVELEGDGIAADMPTYYKGNFPSGSTDSYTVNITPESPEAKSGKLVFSYEDTTGEKHTIEKDFKINVSDFDPMAQGGFEEIPMEPPKTTNWPVIIGGGLALLAGAGGAVLYRRRKKKKEEEDLSLDED